MTARFGSLLAAAALSRVVSAQNPGTITPEVHPLLTTYKCTVAGGCAAQNTSVVLDWNYRWIHSNDSSSTSCTASGGVNRSLCPDEATCAKNCVVEGVNYASYGVATSGSALTLNQYVTTGGTTTSQSPRVYLLGDDGNYVMMQLSGKELSFDVDLSTLPCGENGALYLSEMDATGGRSQYQTGGANYGSGYCDAQCPVQNWKNGTLNTANSGYCCNEMDILEANSRANAFTPHPCSASACDSSGCGFNPYSQGHTSYYGPGFTVDTSRPFTIVTQFLTNDGTQSGTLSQIVRHYIQDGVTIPGAVTASGDTITESWCESADGAALSYGGLPTMGKALSRGMVLIFSIWNDASQFMNWLDSGSNGPCSSTEGNPTLIQANHPDAKVVFSNIKWGEIGSTFGNSGSGSSSSSTTSTRASTSTVSSTSSTLVTSKTTAAPTTTGASQTHWGQCGGSFYTGPTACEAPYACSTQNAYYAQCL